MPRQHNCRGMSKNLSQIVIKERNYSKMKFPLQHEMKFPFNLNYRKISNIRHTKSKNSIASRISLQLVFFATYWSLVISGEWRCSWSCADRQCSNYIWLINNLIAYKGVAYIRDLMNFFFFSETGPNPYLLNISHRRPMLWKIHISLYRYSYVFLILFQHGNSSLCHLDISSDDINPSSAQAITSRAKKKTWLMMPWLPVLYSSAAMIEYNSQNYRSSKYEDHIFNSWLNRSKNLYLPDCQNYRFFLAGWCRI